MSFEHEHRVIEERISANWSSPPDVYYEEQPRPDGLAEFLSVSVMPGRGRHLFPSEPEYRHVGLVTADIFVARNSGTRRARALGDSFAALWRTSGKPLALTDAQAGVIRFVRPPYIGEIKPVQEWLHLEVIAPYQRDVTLS